MQYLQRSTKEGNRVDSLGYNFGLAEIKNEDIMSYADYKSGSADTLSKERLQEMQVLDSLYKLGFPANEEGTYLYKYMIMKALHHLDGFDDIGLPISEENLLAQMQEPFSQFYLETARYDLDIGIKTFHAYIRQALSNVNYARVDSRVLSEIYGGFSEEADYGKHAFVIAKRIHDKSKKVQASTTKETGYQYVKAMAAAATE